MTLPKTYKKLVVVAPGPDFAAATRVVEAPLPAPGPDEILIRNCYAGVNASDPVFASGGYGAAATPFDVGIDSSGEVVAVGTAVTLFKVGDHALVSGFGGGYAEYRLANAATALPIPSATPEITSVYIAGLTASIGLHETGAMKSGDTVLVTAAAGGVGSYAVQLAKLAGNRVIGTCGSEEKVEWLRRLGCDRVINYRREDLDAVLTQEYPGGIDLVCENVGRAQFDIALRHLAVFGRLVCIGAVSEYGGGLAWEEVKGPRIYRDLLAKSASVRACFLPHYAAQIPAHLQQLLTLLEQGRLHAEIDPVEFRGIDAVVAASAHLQAGRNRGKVLVRF